MDDAVEPHVSATVIQVPVPLGVGARTSRPSTGRSRPRSTCPSEGLVLTPPTQPEVQAFRRWICRQVLSRPPAARPEPWRTPGRRRRTGASCSTGGTRDVVTEATHRADRRRRDAAGSWRSARRRPPDPRVRRRRRARGAADRHDRPGALPAGPRRRLHDVPAGRAASRCWTGRSWSPRCAGTAARSRSSCWCATPASATARAVLLADIRLAPTEPAVPVVGRAGYRRQRDRTDREVECAREPGSAPALLATAAVLLTGVQRRPSSRGLAPAAPAVAGPPGARGPPAPRAAAPPDHADGPARAAGRTRGWPRRSPGRA